MNEEDIDQLTPDEFDKYLELEELDDKVELLKKRQKLMSQDELKILRDELFQHGSEFSPVSRDDIIGIDNILNQIDDIVMWLKNPEPFVKYGARPEPGILLEGAPGTGKTLCSRYIASCSNALFLNVRDFPTEKEVIGATDIADMFRRCRDYYADNKRPVVIFWDEFEVFAREREKVGQTMRDASVVSQLTAELDGVAGKAEGVLFVGCTNYKKLVDVALLRPGRMGLHIRFVAPDKRGKAKLLQHYLGKFQVADDLDYESASYFFNDDDTAAAVEEAAQKVWMRAIMTMLRDKVAPIVKQDILNEVLLENLLGPPPPFMELRPDSEFTVAVHELGHALVAHALGVGIQVITIQPGRDSFGRVMTHNVDRKISNVNDIRNQICVGLGSVLAEQVVGIPNSAHATKDIHQSTHFAAEIVDDLGQDHNLQWPGPLSIKGLNMRSSYIQGAISQELLESFDRRVGSLMLASYKLTSDIINDIGKEAIVKLARKLLEDKTWTGKQFESVFEMCRPKRDRSEHPSFMSRRDAESVPRVIRGWSPLD